MPQSRRSHTILTLLSATTIFLIAASYLFTRSCPWLEDRLIRNRLFAPFLQYMDSPATMPRRSRIIVIAIMWTSVLISSWLLSDGLTERLWLPMILVAAAMVGTWVIARWGSRAGAAASPPHYESSPSGS